MQRIIMQLSGEFTKWIILANVIGWPIVYYGMSIWLENFAYRIDMSIMPFMQGAVLIFILAMFIICFRAIKAATVNPVQSLRHD